jgi:hypothetical protein
MKFQLLGIILIVISGILSWNISMSADLSKLELGAIVNLIYPIIFLTLSIVLFALLTWKAKRNSIKTALLIFFILFNLLLGLYIRFADF